MGWWLSAEEDEDNVVWHVALSMENFMGTHDLIRLPIRKYKRNQKYDNNYVELKDNIISPTYSYSVQI